MPGHSPACEIHHALKVQDLSIDYVTDVSHVIATLRGVSFSVAAGEVVGVLGESGSGKTSLALALCRLLPVTAVVRSGHVFLGNVDLLRINERQMEKIRGTGISFLGQDPASSLNPVLRVGLQVREVVRARAGGSASHCRDITMGILRRVGLEGSRYYDAYPHQLSGGQRQRIAIAQALACSPRFLIADEPTSALDPVVQAAILDLLQELVEETGTSLLLISHDPALVQRVTSRVLVMYAGRIVESGPTAAVYAGPRHPYTNGLLRSRPRFEHPHKQELPCIPGVAPEISSQSDGCAFAPRCERRIPKCTNSDPVESVDTIALRTTRCFQPFD